MNDSNKILKIVFFVLLFVTVGELFYFFVYKPINKPPLVTPKFIPSQEDLAFNKESLDNLLLLKNDIVKSSTINNEYQGIIIGINYKKDPLENQDEYQLKIRIKGESGNINSFYYSSDEVNRIAIFNMNNDQKEQYPLDKLMIGDQISIKTSYDLLNNNNVIEEEIIKL